MKDKIKIVTLDTPHCDITKHVNNLLELEEFSDFEKINTKNSDFSLFIKGLSEGEYDIIAMTGQELHGKELEMLQYECHVSGAITPRRPNMLLISENKIDYQPKSAIILCDQKIIRRQ